MTSKPPMDDQRMVTGAENGGRAHDRVAGSPLQRREAHASQIPARQCGAKTRSGAPCKNAPMPNGRCRMHGGKALAGQDHPNFVDGRNMSPKYRVIFGGQDLAAYERSLNDPDQLALSEELAALHALALQELKRAKIGDGAPLWLDLRAAWKRFERAQASGQAGRAASALTEIGQLIGEGGDRAAGQREAVDYFERIRKLSETERRRILEGQQVLTAAQALSFAAQINGIVRRRIAEVIGGTPEERQILAGIAEDIARLIRSDVGEIRGDAPADL